MKLQIRIAKQICKLLKKINIILGLSLLLYFLVFLVINKYDFIYFKYIFGVKSMDSPISIALFFINLSYIIYITYKFVSYEYGSMPYEIMLRFNPKRWFVSKIVILSLIIFLFKTIQIILFNTLGYLLVENYIFDFNFFIINILYFIFIGLFFAFILCNNNLFINIIIGILMILSIKLGIVELALFLSIVFVILLLRFNFKKINSIIKL